MNAFVADQLTVRYEGSARDALTDVSVAVPTAKLFAVIGPNGSGKSTLIKSLLGAVAPTNGTVHFGERRLGEWPRRELARQVGAVAQMEDLAFPMTVRELVSMGRYPHVGNLRRETAHDRAAIERALARCDILPLADRMVGTLSGGERQRARIARALAQEPRVLILDEPTSALDIAHEMALFELLRSFTRNDGWTVVIATHEINLAARFADAMLLLHRGRTIAFGNPQQVMKRESLEQVYEWPLLQYTYGGAGFDYGAPQITPLSVLEIGE